MVVIKFEIEHFNETNNFNIWQSYLKDLLVQQGLLKVLKGEKPKSMTTDEWEELEVRVVSTIYLYLASAIKYSVLNKKCPFGLWHKLGKIYMSKSLTNRLYLKKQLYGLKMSKGSDIRDNINQFNKCIT